MFWLEQAEIRPSSLHPHQFDLDLMFLKNGRCLKFFLEITDTNEFLITQTKAKRTFQHNTRNMIHLFIPHAKLNIYFTFKPP